MVSVVSPSPEVVRRSRSLCTKMEYRSGERIAPCLTPWWMGKLVEMAWFHVTEHEEVLQRRCQVHIWIPLWNSLPSCHTVSNAFLASRKAT